VLRVLYISNTAISNIYLYQTTALTSLFAPNSDLTPLDLSTEGSGIYFIKVYNDTPSVNKKIIKH
jgi:hypothetical protein